MMRLLQQTSVSFSSDSSTPSVQLPPPRTTSINHVWNSYRRRNVLDDECDFQKWGTVYSLLPPPPPPPSSDVISAAIDEIEVVERAEREGSGGEMEALNEEEVRGRIETEEDDGRKERQRRQDFEMPPHISIAAARVDEEMELLLEAEEGGGGDENNNINYYRMEGMKNSSEVKRRRDEREMIMGGRGGEGNNNSGNLFFPSSSSSSVSSSSSRWRNRRAEEEKGKEEEKSVKSRKKENDNYHRIDEVQERNVSVSLKSEYTKDMLKKEEEEESRLSWIFATAICGNDITSSAFYNVGSLFVSAGRLAPLCTLLAIVTLYFYKEIYREVICAIPLNGGVYNCVLNSTDKIYASILSCLVILSYISTCVVSAVTAVEYFNFLLKTLQTPSSSSSDEILIITTSSTSSPSLLPSLQLPLVGTALLIIIIFALLQHLGLRESSFVALLLFVFHFASLFCLFLLCLFHVSIYGITATSSSPSPPPSVVSTIPSTMTTTSPSSLSHPPLLFHEDKNPSWLLAIASGLGSAISGFETAANFVEQQQPGVFPIAVNNMWLIFSVVNLLLCICSLITTPLSELVSNANHCVEYVGAKIGGRQLQHLLALDAVAILCGSVLSSFIGVTGLLGRMAKDNCLPSMFSDTTRTKTSSSRAKEEEEEVSVKKKRKWGRERKSSIWSTLLFVIVCSMLCYMSDGDVESLSTIYTLSILSVLFVFAIAGLHLKINRPQLPRTIVTHWTIFLLAGIITGSSLLTIWFSRTRELCLLLLQFFICSSVVLVTFHRTTLLKLGLLFMREVCGSHTWCKGCNAQAERVILDYVNRWQKQSIIYFAKTADAATLNRAVQYIIRNEEARWLRILHAYQHESLIPPGLQDFVYFLDFLYPTLRIDCVFVKSSFNRQLLLHLSKLLDVAVENMFISCPKDFQIRLEQLGGVRVILASYSAPSLSDTSLIGRLMSSSSNSQEDMSKNRHENEEHEKRDYAEDDGVSCHYNYFEQQLSK